MATTLFLAPMVLKTSLVVLDFFASLTLIDRRLWILVNTLVERVLVDLVLLESFSFFFAGLYP